jgi:hypothetical protein
VQGKQHDEANEDHRQQPAPDRDAVRDTQRPRDAGLSVDVSTADEQGISDALITYQVPHRAAPESKGPVRDNFNVEQL